MSDVKVMGCPSASLKQHGRTRIGEELVEGNTSWCGKVAGREQPPKSWQRSASCCSAVSSISLCSPASTHGSLATFNSCLCSASDLQAKDVTDFARIHCLPDFPLLSLSVASKSHSLFTEAQRSIFRRITWKWCDFSPA